jgi:hypothetical protein
VHWLVVDLPLGAELLHPGHEADAKLGGCPAAVVCLLVEDRVGAVLVEELRRSSEVNHSCS